MKAYQKLLGITLATAIGALALPTEANADQVSNGKSFNGVRLNGASLNGVVLNGVGMNGLRINGLRINGFSLTSTGQGMKPESAKTGLTLSSPNYTSIKVEGGRLVGVK